MSVLARQVAEVRSVAEQRLYATMVATDNASYSDIAFGLFTMVRFNFSPRFKTWATAVLAGGDARSGDRRVTASPPARHARVRAHCVTRRPPTSTRDDEGSGE